MTPRVLSIAGSDSGGGAGIQADIRTITNLGGHAMTAITAVTAQNSVGVQRVDVMPPEALIAQISAVVDDIGLDAVKIGMLGSVENAKAVADWLADGCDVPVIFDPVMVATSGANLADDAVIDAFEQIIAHATLVTPNLQEWDRLGGEGRLLDGKAQWLVKGGHGEGDILIDRLIGPDGEVARWEGERIDTRHSHGTGCTLSSAIATLLGQGYELEDAIAAARTYVRLSLHDAPGLGRGSGPMGASHLNNDGHQPMPVLNQVTLGSSDYAQSVNFYKQLGLHQIVDSPVNGYARFVAFNGTSLSIHLTDQPVNDSVVYFEHGNLDRWCEELASKGVTFEQMPRDESWGWREARLRDPHGNIICLFHAGEMRRFPPWRLR